MDWLSLVLIPTWCNHVARAAACSWELSRERDGGWNVRDASFHPGSLSSGVPHHSAVEPKLLHGIVAGFHRAGLFGEDEPQCPSAYQASACTTVAGVLLVKASPPPAQPRDSMGGVATIYSRKEGQRVNMGLAGGTFATMG